LFVPRDISAILFPLTFVSLQYDPFAIQFYPPKKYMEKERKGKEWFSFRNFHFLTRELMDIPSLIEWKQLWIQVLLL
jgi:hypothetical protein